MISQLLIHANETVTSRDFDTAIREGFYGFHQINMRKIRVRQWLFEFDDVNEGTANDLMLHVLDVVRQYGITPEQIQFFKLQIPRKK